jgi:histidinol dehydrogenase
MAQWLFTEAADFETKFGAFLSANRERGEEVDAALCRLMRNAGAIFLGSSTPEAITHFSSGLGFSDFIKRTSILKTRSEALPELGCHAIGLARAEGLEAHARSIAIRLNEP